MSGHSKWSTIKRDKAKTDSARGKLFSKISREITVAAKTGGGDTSGNARLRIAIDKARSVNMPKNNIEKAILRGAGGAEGSTIEEITYEGYGSQGVAVIVEVMTDNKNRTLGEIQFIFSRHGGNLGKAGSVAWQFTKYGVLTADKSAVSLENIINDAIEAGAEDINEEDSTIEIKIKPEKYEEVLSLLNSKGYSFTSSEITMLPNNSVAVSGTDAEKLMKLVGALEDHDDVQNVYANFEIPNEINR